MSRSVEEWVGPNDDAMPPPRVRIRIFDKYNGRCRICTKKILAGEYWQSGHIIAIIAGGKNIESNYGPECRNCSKDTTRKDVAEKSKVATLPNVPSQAPAV